MLFTSLTLKDFLEGFHLGKYVKICFYMKNQTIKLKFLGTAWKLLVLTKRANYAIRLSVSSFE